MRILQARFHFHADSQHAPIVVGHLVWESDEPAAVVWPPSLLHLLSESELS